jgi:hypothetical protein
MTSIGRLTAREGALLKATILVAVGLWIFSPVFNGDWIWDDTTLVAENDSLRSLTGLGKIWFAAPATDYWPMTWTLLWVEWHLWGAHTLGYHLCSVALHLTSAFLIWRLFSKLGLRWGWLGGLVFVVHPLAVESVAWISEIKNTLSLPFFLLSLNAYIDADQGRGGKGYGRALLFYLIAMLCKSSVVMLPVDLLLYHWWRHGRITWFDCRRMLPYIAIALALGSVTLYFQATHYTESDVVRDRGIITRLIGAGAAIFFYIGKFILPVDLVPIYPRWNLNPPSLSRLLTLPLLALTLAALWTKRKTWGRHALFGVGFFLINLLPVIGLCRMTWMNVSWVADHLVYIPMIGLIGCAVAGLEVAHRNLSPAARPWLFAAITALIILMARESHWYAGMFVDLKTLRTLTVQRDWN